MSYLPHGWTEERLAAATADDLKALPYETLHLIPVHKVVAHDAQDVLLGARVDELTRSERARFGLDPVPHRFAPGAEAAVHAAEKNPAVRATTVVRNRQFLDDARKRYFDALLEDGSLRPPAPPPKAKLPADPVVQVVEAGGYEDFGFLMVRLVYDDDARWDRFYDLYMPPLDAELAKAEGGERIVDNLLMMSVEDTELDGAGFQGALAYCEELHEEHLIPPGLDTNIILVVDEQALQSFLEPTPGQKPWVWAVDAEYPFEVRQQPPQGDPPTDAYPGYFRVALSAAVLDLWPLLKSPGGIQGRRLWDPDTPIWDGICG